MGLGLPIAFCSARLLLLAVLFAPALGCDRDKTVLRVGALIPLSGTAATYGLELRRGIDLALEQVNQGGGIAATPLEVSYQDSKADPIRGREAFRALLSEKRPQLVIGGMFSAETLAVAPIAQKDRIVLISPTSSAAAISSAGDYIFRIYPSDQADGEFLANFAYKELGARTAGVIYLNVTSTATIAQIYKAAFEHLGATVTLLESFEQGDKDFGHLLSALSGAKLDVLFVPGYGPALRDLLLALYQGGVTRQILGVSAIQHGDFISELGNAAEGLIFSTPAVDLSSPTAPTNEFVAAYERKFHREPEIWAAYGYDALRLAVEALRRSDASRSSPEALRNALHKIAKFPGVTGPITFDENGDVEAAFRTYIIKNGSAVPYVHRGGAS